MTVSNDLLSVDRMRELMADPDAVQGSDLPGLRAWRDRFPYAPVFGVLVAKSAAVAGSVDQQAELLRAAANVASQGGLFEWFVRPSLVEEARQIEAHLEAANTEKPHPSGKDKERRHSTTFRKAKVKNINFCPFGASRKQKQKVAVQAKISQTSLARQVGAGAHLSA